MNGASWMEHIEAIIWIYVWHYAVTSLCVQEVVEEQVAVEEAMVAESAAVVESEQKEPKKVWSSIVLTNYGKQISDKPYFVIRVCCMLNVLNILIVLISYNPFPQFPV